MQDAAENPPPGSRTHAEQMRLQSARGLACLLLVAYHVIGEPVTGGLLLPASSPYHYFTLLFLPLRMPLFAFLSGFVYAYRPAVYGNRLRFLGKKVRRIFIPLIVVTTIYTVRQVMTATDPAATWSGAWHNYVYPLHQLWFLQAILLIFAATVLLELVMTSFRGYLVALAAAILLQVLLINDSNFLLARGAVFLLPLFLLGLGANRFRAQFGNPRTQAVCLGAFLVTAAVYTVMCLTGHAYQAGRGSALGTLLSLCSCLVVLYRMPAISWLAWIGTFSFGIFLYHFFFIDGAQLVSQAADIHDVTGNFLLQLTAGLIGPALLELGLRRSFLARRLLFGLP
jgi:peptidoglycan/LPS O-acetylase OafA/YrhL